MRVQEGEPLQQHSSPGARSVPAPRRLWLPLEPATGTSGPVPHPMSGPVIPTDEIRTPWLREVKELAQGHIYLVGQPGFEPRFLCKACVFPAISQSSQSLKCQRLGVVSE